MQTKKILWGNICLALAGVLVFCLTAISKTNLWRNLFLRK
jgi:hypothetical protein